MHFEIKSKIYSLNMRLVLTFESYIVFSRCLDLSEFVYLFRSGTLFSEELLQRRDVVSLSF